jgi:hypothetical protein
MIELRLKKVRNSYSGYPFNSFGIFDNDVLLHVRLEYREVIDENIATDWQVADIDYKVEK